MKFREKKYCNEKSICTSKQPDAVGRTKKKNKNLHSNIIQNDKAAVKEKTKSEDKFKKFSLSKPKIVQSIHPALLSPKTTKKYRRSSSTNYQLPELALAPTEN